MELLIAYRDDPAGHNMARFLARDMRQDGEVFHGSDYDLAVIPTPAISADWLEEKYDYDGYVFLSRHAAESNVLALTCHSTGNFAGARFGGNDRQVAVPHPGLQKTYLRILHENRESFPEFQITIEATHHGPTALSRPSMFVEIGTTMEQWTNVTLCNRVASLVHLAMTRQADESPTAICFGGTHYPKAFTREIISGRYAIGTVMPRHALDCLDEELFRHILSRNQAATAALLDWSGLGPHRQKLIKLLERTELEVVRL